MNRLSGYGRFLILILCFVLLNNTAKSSVAVPPVSGGTAGPDLWAYKVLNLVRHEALPKRVITVAVIDDGFRLSHKALKDYVYFNEKEIAGNFQDDDRNGFIDDMSGWDISDGDSDVSVLKGKEDVFYHGTYIAGIIASLFEKTYGADASRFLKIIPVKVLSNQSKNTYLADGYKGIKYAADLGADIICCAWSGGVVSEEEKSFINQAVGKGIMVIGSAGNFYAEKSEFPSAANGAVSVAAVDSLLRKSKVSNYGLRIDISAPGVSVYGPHPKADNSFFYQDGTSPAAAIIAGCAAILKALGTDDSSRNILDALQNTSVPVDSVNLTFCGKLGSGIPNMARAMDFITAQDYKYSTFHPSRTEGKVFYSKRFSSRSWMIQPFGAYKGIHLYSDSPDHKGKVLITCSDSICFSGAIGDLSNGLYFPGSSFRIELPAKGRVRGNPEFSYYMETTDSTSLYCKDITDLEGPSGVLTDNSGDENYANNSSCKWQIRVPAGMKIRIEFEALDTQANVDFLWFFDGASALQENLVAKVSGIYKPPVITSLTNELLVWFLTDGHTTSKGWKINYTAVD